MNFEWDEAKNRANYAKHGVSFELARNIFNDPLVTYLFERFVDGEERGHAIGRTQALPVLVVVLTYRDHNGEEVIRLISARQASSHERRLMGTVEIPSVEEQIADMKQKDDKDIDFSDIPEILDWSGAVRGKLYRPVKRHVTLRLDADVLEWFRHRNAKYQTAINTALREYIHSHS